MSTQINACYHLFSALSKRMDMPEPPIPISLQERVRSLEVDGVIDIPPESIRVLRTTASRVANAFPGRVYKVSMVRKMARVWRRA